MRIFSLILLLLPMTVAQAADGFIWPLACTPNVDCGVVLQPDTLERKGDMMDAACGVRTTDNRIDTIIALPGVAAIRQGVAVRAIEDGQIENMENRLPDRPGKGCGNFVLLWHKGGWTSEYCGLRHGSTKQKKGDYVRQGETIGLAGMSGGLRWPGLAFTLRKFDRPYDLWSGNAVTAGCGKLRPMIPGLQYWPVAAIQTGITETPPTLNTLRTGVQGAEELPAPSPLVLWAHLAGLADGDRLDFELFHGGTVIWQTGGPADPRSPVVYAVKKAPADGWPQGLITGRITVTRDNAILLQTETRVLIK